MRRYHTIPQLFTEFIAEDVPMNEIEEVFYVIAHLGHAFITIGRGTDDEETYEITWQGHEQVSVRAIAYPTVHQISRGAW